MGGLGIVSAVDQFLFGYNSGHRLIAGSRELAPPTLVRLLGATDAAMTPRCPPLVTGLPLPEIGRFALCVTWAATEMPRVGAVWAHVIVADESHLRDPRAFAALIGLPRRPQTADEDLTAYTIRLSSDGLEPRAPRYTNGRSVDPALLHRLALAAYGGGLTTVVVHEDAAGAAAAAISLWAAQWPELRAVFAFRTREIARLDRSEFNLTVAAKIRGHDDPSAEWPSSKQPRWAAAIAADAASDRGGRLREFLWTYGSQESPEPTRVRALAGLWVRVEAGDVEGARTHLERYWPLPRAGAALKLALFGRSHNRWWSAGERERVAALLSSRHETWDLAELDLTGRVRVLARSADTG